MSAKETVTNSETTDKRLENLKPFPKGVSGNPKGRPKGRKNNVTIFREILEARDLKESDPTTYLFSKLVDIIEDENPNISITRQAGNDILDRLYGKPESTVKHGRTPEELALAGKDVINDLLVKAGIEEAEIVEE